MSQRIVIVGAGLSGMSAAAKLIENGYDDIVILEAENRIGGRIHSVPQGSGFIDLGAQWCHGEGGNVIYQLVSNHFTFGDTGVENVDPVFQLSTGVSANQAEALKLAALAESIMEDNEAMESFAGSLGDFFITKYREALKTTTYNTIPVQMTNQMLEFLHTEITTEFASPTWFNVSARLNALSYETTGNQYLTWKTSGFKTVFDYITKKLPNELYDLNVESKVQLNKEVTNIKYSTTTSDKVTVTCADGSTQTADHVIFTGSLGVLKARHTTLFTPGLPSTMVKAINNIGFGTLDKIFLEFDVPFWPLNKASFVGYSFLWTAQNLTSVKLTDRAWLTGINSFIIVDGFPNLLETVIAGVRIAEFEALSDTKVVNDCMWLLESFLGKKLPTPKSMKRTAWAKSKNFLGSYSYQSMSTASNNVGPNNLAKSIVNYLGAPVVMFAGEATDAKYSSYAHGAVSSGWRAANELMTYLEA